MTLYLKDATFLDWNTFRDRERTVVQKGTRGGFLTLDLLP